MSREPNEPGVSAHASMAEFMLEREKRDAAAEVILENISSRLLMRTLAKRYIRETVESGVGPWPDAATLYEAVQDACSENGFEDFVNDWSDHLDEDLCQVVLDEVARGL